MNAQRSAFLIYVLGISLLGFFLGAYGAQAQAYLGSWKFVVAAIAYLVLVRFIAEFAKSKLLR